MIVSKTTCFFDNLSFDLRFYTFDDRQYSCFPLQFQWQWFRVWLPHMKCVTRLHDWQTFQKNNFLDFLNTVPRPQNLTDEACRCQNSDPTKKEVAQNPDRVAWTEEGPPISSGAND